MDNKDRAREVRTPLQEAGRFVDFSGVFMTNEEIVYLGDTIARLTSQARTDALREAAETVEAYDTFDRDVVISARQAATACGIYAAILSLIPKEPV